MTPLHLTVRVSRITMPETKTGDPEIVKQLDLQVVRCDSWKDMHGNKTSKGPKRFECDLCFKNFNEDSAQVWC